MVVLGAQGSMELQIGSFEDRIGIEGGGGGGGKILTRTTSALDVGPVYILSHPQNKFTRALKRREFHLDFEKQTNLESLRLSHRYKPERKWLNKQA